MAPGWLAMLMGGSTDGGTYGKDTSVKKHRNSKKEDIAKIRQWTLDQWSVLCCISCRPSK